MLDDLDSKQPQGAPLIWDTERILPHGFLPMLPTSASGPLESAHYAYEVRWDGLRILAGLEATKLFLRSGTGQDAGFWFPEVARVRGAAAPAWVLLDGELVALDEDGNPSIQNLQQRLRAADVDEVKHLSEEAPVTFMVQDILRIGDSWLLDVSWEERREILTRAVRAVPGVQIAPAGTEGADMIALARELGLEAVLAKRLRGRYYPGEKTRDWLNIKPMEVLEAIICGWMEGRGARGGTIGSLLLGVRRGNGIQYIGHTGTGIDARTLPILHEELTRLSLAGCPFAEEPALTTEPHWVRPVLRCRVRHQGWADTGKMRSPTFLELLDQTASLDVSLHPDAAPRARR